jgi:hypothetical protein
VDSNYIKEISKRYNNILKIATPKVKEIDIYKVNKSILDLFEHINKNVSENLTYREFLSLDSIISDLHKIAIKNSKNISALQQILQKAIPILIRMKILR